VHKIANILVLTHWSFRDALVQTYTLPYLKIIRSVLPKNQKIILVTVEQKNIALTDNEVKNINQNWEIENLSLVAQAYQAMGVLKMLTLVYQLCHLIFIVKYYKISTIHCFCTPAGAIGFLLSKITGARLIIDSYEPHAQSMLENGTWSKWSAPYRLLSWFERLQTQRATCFIATTAGMKKYAQRTYGVDPKVFYIKPACVNLEVFNLREADKDLVDELGLRGKIVCVYAGKLGGIYLNSEVFDFIQVCYKYWGDNFRFLLLTNSPRDKVLQEIERVGLHERTVIQKQVKYEDVPRYLSISDFAINPVKPVPTKKYCTSIKDGEYWASGLPVVITKDISDDSDIIRESGYGYELQKLDFTEYKLAILTIDKLINGNVFELSQNIREIAKKYRNYQIAINIYTEIYS
jgi:glycosyltransferase involved in cell wall biosynthesis